MEAGADEAVAAGVAPEVAAWLKALGKDFLEGRDKMIAAEEASWRQNTTNRGISDVRRTPTPAADGRPRLACRRTAIRRGERRVRPIRPKRIGVRTSQRVPARRSASSCSASAGSVFAMSGGPGRRSRARRAAATSPQEPRRFRRAAGGIRAAAACTHAGAGPSKTVPVQPRPQRAIETSDKRHRSPVESPKPAPVRKAPVRQPPPPPPPPKPGVKKTTTPPP